MNKSKKTEINHRNITDLVDLDDKNCLNKLNLNDWKILIESKEELNRACNMERIFPS